MLEVIGLHKKYGKFTAVDNLNLTIEDETIFGFIGPNGAGKTTTLKIISGLLAATSGDVYIDGVNVIKDHKQLSSKIGYMPDFFGVYDNLKVSEYMDFYAGTYYIPYSERNALIDNLLELVDLTHKKNAYVDSLSRGMKQRLCLARSLVHDPQVLILDEPASGLDPRARVEMKEVLRQLKTLGKTIIISSHILSELAEFCTVVGIIKSGNMVACGTVNQITKQLNANRIVKIKPLDNMEKLMRILQEKATISEIIENTEDVEFYFDGDDKQLSELIKEVVIRNIPILSVREKEGNLEEIFMQLTEAEVAENNIDLN